MINSNINNIFFKKFVNHVYYTIVIFRLRQCQNKINTNNVKQHAKKKVELQIVKKFIILCSI